jgi:hypothetical protein
MMIYKFKFEVCNDNNELIFARGEESGNFWKAYLDFMFYLMGYARWSIPTEKIKL